MSASRACVVDVAVVGGGVAGLLAAYRVLQQHPSWRVVVLERATHVGGRTRTAHFAGQSVSAGAGVGRTGKDVRLAQLLRELGLLANDEDTSNVRSPRRSVGSLPQKVRQVHSSSVPTGDQVDIAKTRTLPPTIQADGRQVARLDALKAARVPDAHDDTTFRTFARRILGNEEFRAFMTTMGHTDMLEASARETMLHYGLEDNVHAWIPFAVPWNALADELQTRVNAFRNGQVLTNARVAHIAWNTTAADDDDGMATNKSHAPTETTPDAITSDLHVIHSLPNMHRSDRMVGRHGGARRQLESRITAKRVVLAVPIDALRPLLPPALQPCFRHIHGQPFVRVYARVATHDIPFVAERIGRHRVVAHSPLMKMNPINARDGVFMVAFADGAAARHRARYLHTDARNPLDYLERLVTDALHVEEEPRSPTRQARRASLAGSRPHSRARRHASNESSRTRGGSMRSRTRGGSMRSRTQGGSMRSRMRSRTQGGSTRGGSKARVSLVDFKMFAFQVGTHYYEPQKLCSNKETNKSCVGAIAHAAHCSLFDRHVFVVGEAVSHNQGWTEGALETVETVMQHIR